MLHQKSPKNELCGFPGNIADGFVDQLDEFAEGHGDTGLVIVDTRQKVRQVRQSTSLWRKLSWRSAV